MLKNLISVLFKEQISIKMIRASSLKRALYITGILLFIVIIYISIFFPMIVSANEFADMLNVDLGKLLISVTLRILFVLSLVMSFGFIISGCYLDKGISNYLVLPISRRSFTFAKVLVAYINVIGMLYFISLPFIVTYLMLSKVTISGVLALIIFPMISTLFSMYIAMLLIGTLMYFVNKINNKVVARRVLYAILGSIGMGLYLFVVIFVSFQAASVETMEQALVLYSQFSNFMSSLFMIPVWSTRFFLDGEISKLLYTLIVLAVGSLAYLYFEKVYFKGATGFAEGGSSNRTRRRKITQNAGNISVTRWFFYREFKELTSGVYFMNTLFANILIVVIYLGMFVFSVFFSPDSSLLLEMIRTSSDYFTLSNIMLATVALTTVFSFFSFGGATSFSRDAYNMEHISTLPIDKSKAFMGKVMFNAVVEFLTIFAFLVPIYLIVKVNIAYIFIAILVMALVSITLNFIPIIADLLVPTLDWQSQTALVKRSKSTLLSIFFNTIYILGFGVVNYQLITSFNVSLQVLPFMLIAYYIILFVVLYMLYKRLMIRAFLRIKK